MLNGIEVKTEIEMKVNIFFFPLQSLNLLFQVYLESILSSFRFNDILKNTIFSPSKLKYFDSQLIVKWQKVSYSLFRFCLQLVLIKVSLIASVAKK